MTFKCKTTNECAVYRNYIDVRKSLITLAFNVFDDTPTKEQTIALEEFIN